MFVLVYLHCIFPILFHHSQDLQIKRLHRVGWVRWKVLWYGVILSFSPYISAFSKDMWLPCPSNNRTGLERWATPGTNAILSHVAKRSLSIQSFDFFPRILLGSLAVGCRKTVAVGGGNTSIGVRFCPAGLTAAIRVIMGLVRRWYCVNNRVTFASYHHSRLWAEIESRLTGVEASERGCKEGCILFLNVSLKLLKPCGNFRLAD